MLTTLSLSPAVDKIFYINDFKVGGLYRVDKPLVSAGGKGINVARVASLLGQEVTCLGFKAGNTGTWLESEIKKLNIKSDFIKICGESRTNHNFIDVQNKVETEVLEAGPYIDEESILKFEKSLKKVLKSTKILVCSGGLPLGIGKDYYKKIINMANKKSVLTFLDSSNEMLSEGIKANPYLIKPNLRELSNLLNKEFRNIDEMCVACREIVSRGVKIVVLSLGGEGAILVSDKQCYLATIPKISVVNTIGSGDSLLAGIATGILKQLDIIEAFRLGITCGVVNTMFESIGYISTDLIEKYKSQINIQII